MTVATTETLTAGFRVLRRMEVPMWGAVCTESVHDATGAHHLHVATSQRHNLFTSAIRAIPVDETGAPHVLEHCVLTGGSAHYPHGFVSGRAGGGGAWTGAEFTYYRRSAVDHDTFVAVVDHHLDTLFEPLLEEETFWNEAHHLEFDDPLDHASPLRVRGSVRSEMTGAMTVPMVATWFELNRALYPGMPYSLEWGGTRESLVDLTLPQLRDYHARHYHPANAYFVSWGDIPLERLLGTLDGALSRIPARSFTPPTFPPLVPIIEPRSHHGRLPLVPGQKAARAGIALVGWVVGDATDVERGVRLDILDDLLLGDGTAPLRRALVASGLGRGVPDTLNRRGLRYRDLLFTAGVEGLDPADAPEVERMVMETLEALARDGFDAAAVSAAVERAEFRRRTMYSAESGTDGEPGSFILQWLLPTWCNGGDAFSVLALERILDALREELRSGHRVFEELVDEALLRNPHRVLVVLDPDPGGEVRADEAEQRRLAAIAAGLDDAGRAAIDRVRERIERHLAERTHAQAASAEAPIEASTSDEPAPITLVAFDAPVRLDAARLSTHGLTYLDLCADLSSLPDESWSDVALLCRALRRLAASHPLARAAGDGVSAELILPITASGDRVLPRLRLGARGMARSQGDLARLLVDVLESSEIGEAVTAEVIGEARTAAEQDLFIETFWWLAWEAGSRVRSSAEMQSRYKGLASLLALRRLAAGGDDAVTATTERLNGLRSLLRMAPLEVCAIVDVDADLAALGAAVGGAVQALGDNRSAPGGLPETPSVVEPRHRAWRGPTPSAFNCQVHRHPGMAHADGPALTLATAYSSLTWVRGEVVTRGTAYGGGAETLTDAALTVMLGIRDPQVASTYAIFDEAPRRIAGGPVDAGLLDAIKPALQRLVDPSGTEANRARQAWLDQRTGFDGAARSLFVRRALETGPDDLVRVAATYLGDGVRATIAPAAMLEGAEHLFDVVAEL